MFCAWCLYDLHALFLDDAHTSFFSVTGARFRSSTVKKKCIPLGITSSLLQRSSCEKWVRSMLPIRDERGWLACHATFYLLWVLNFCSCSLPVDSLWFPLLVDSLWLPVDRAARGLRFPVDSLWSSEERLDSEVVPISVLCHAHPLEPWHSPRLPVAVESRLERWQPLVLVEDLVTVEDLMLVEDLVTVEHLVLMQHPVIA